MLINVNPRHKLPSSRLAPRTQCEQHNTAQIADDDGLPLNSTLTILNPDNTTSNASITTLASPPSVPYLNIGSSVNSNKGGIYTASLTETDTLNTTRKVNATFDIDDSLYLNVKTDKDIYYFGQKVMLTNATSLNLTKQLADTSPSSLKRISLHTSLKEDHS